VLISGVIVGKEISSVVSGFCGLHAEAVTQISKNQTTQNPILYFINGLLTKIRLIKRMVYLKLKKLDDYQIIGQIMRIGFRVNGFVRAIVFFRILHPVSIDLLFLPSRLTIIELAPVDDYRAYMVILPVEHTIR